MKIGLLESELWPLTETQPSPTMGVAQVRNRQVGCDSEATKSHRDEWQYVPIRRHVNGPHKLNLVKIGPLEYELRPLTTFFIEFNSSAKVYLISSCPSHAKFN